MLEGKGNVVLQQDLLKAIKCGTREAQNIVLEIERLQKAYGKQKREVEKITTLNEEISSAVLSMCEMRLREIFQDASHDKISRDMAVNEVRTNVIDKVWSSYPNTDPSTITDEFNRCCKTIFRELVFETNLRCDGRDFDSLRNISCQVRIIHSLCESYIYNLICYFQVDLYKPLHGSALFQRGQTQVFCTVALDSQESAMKLDTLTALEW